MEENKEAVLHPRMPNAGNVLYQWEVPEYELHQRGMWWYIIASALMLALLGYAVATANFLFALLIILFAAIIFLHHTNEPLIVEVTVTDLGLVLNNAFYPYHALESFWIVFEPPFAKHLYIAFKSAVRPSLAIHMADQNPVEIRSALRKFVLEDLEKKEEPMSDVLWRMLKL